jgi:hypothetical protein
VVITMADDLHPGDLVVLTHGWVYQERHYPEGTRGVVAEVIDRSVHALLADRLLLAVWLDEDRVVMVPGTFLQRDETGTPAGEGG